MKPLRGSRFLLTFAIILMVVFQLSWSALMTTKMIGTQKLIGRADFACFYAAGRVARALGYSSIYDVQAQKVVQERVLGVSMPVSAVLLYNHPPFLAPLQWLMAVDNYKTAYILWGLLNITWIAVGLWLAFRYFLASGWKKRQAVSVVLAAALFYPLVVSVIKGQDTAFSFLGFLLIVCGLLTENWIMAGAGLAVICIRPQIALIVAIPILLKVHKPIKWFIVALLVFSLTVWPLGYGGISQFLGSIFFSIGGSGVMSRSGMFNLVGILYRFGVADQTITIIAWIFYILCFIGVCVLWLKSSQPPAKLLAMTVILAIFFSPHSQYHDLTFLLIPIFLLPFVSDKERAISPMALAVIILLISTIFLVGDFIDIIRYTFPYFLMLGLLVYIWMPAKKKDLPVPSQT